MKRFLLALLVGALLSPAAFAQNFTVDDSNGPWLGFMNVFELPANGGGFVFGSAWGTNDLVSTFDDPNNTVSLFPNSINDPNEFWYQNTSGTAPDPMNPGGPGQLGNKIMDANLYVEIDDDALAGQFLTFSGNVQSNTFTAAHNASIFIRDFAPDYSSVNEASIPLVPGPFNVNLLSLPGTGRHIQYGFNVNGENVWITDIGPFGSAVIDTVAGPPPVPFGPYSQDFDALSIGDTDALANDDWLTFATVFDSGQNFKFQYGPNPAPNAQPSSGFSDLGEGQGANGAGDQYLNVFSDYNCCDLDMPGSEQGHGNGTDIVQSTVFREYTVTSADVGRTVEFAFDIKLPGGADAPFALGASGSATAEVFVKTLDPGNNFSESGADRSDILTEIPGLNAATWTPHSLSLEILPSMVGHIFQFGVQTDASNFDPTGVYLDNINLDDASTGPIPGDANCDGVVDLLDLDILGTNFGLTGVGFKGGDLNEDGVVDLLDLDILGTNFGNTGPSASVPEPQTLLLGLLALAPFAIKRK